MSNYNDTDLTPQQIKTGCLGAVAIVLLLILAIGLFKSFNTIDAGDEGVVVCFGQTSGNLDPGLHIVAPWCGVTGLDARTQSYVMVRGAQEGQTKGDDSLAVQSSDQVPLAVDAAVIYHLDRAKADMIYTRFKPVENQTVVLRNTSRRIIHDTGANYTAQDLLGAKRADFGRATEQALGPALAEFGIVLERVEVRDVVATSQAYVDAISQKVAAQQSADAKQYQLQAAQKDVEIKKTQAQGDADAQAIRNSQPPAPALVQQQMVDAIRNTQNRVIITDGKAPVMIQPGG